MEVAGGIKSGWINDASDPASNFYSLVFGRYSSASEGYGIALGDNADARGWAAVALGQNVKAYGFASFAAGLNSSAWFDNSFAAGRDATASATRSVALGTGLETRFFQGMTVGSYAIPRQENFHDWVEDQAIFVVGNGKDANSRSESLVVLKNGATTVQNKHWQAMVASDPTKALDEPIESRSSEGKALTVRGHAEFLGRVTIKEPQGDISMGPFTD